MKFTLHIDEGCEDEVIVHARSKTRLIEEIERLVLAEKHNTPPILGYTGDDIIEIDPQDVVCFYIENKRLYAATKERDLLIKMRLYEIEAMLGGDFVKINQSTVANVHMIEKFSVSLGASLTVHFKNGRRDYVSRRQVRAVKERMGIK